MNLGNMKRAHQKAAIICIYEQWFCLEKRKKLLLENGKIGIVPIT